MKDFLCALWNTMLNLAELLQHKVNMKSYFM